MAFAENLREFMDAQTGFAESVVLGGETGVAIFDAEWADALSMSAPRPVLFVVDSHFGGLDVGDSATVRGDNNTVVEIRPDGQGMSTVVLEGV